MRKSDLEFLKKTFLFRGLSDTSINEILDLVSFTYCSFEKDECIYSPSSYSDKIGFIMDGVCVVQRIHPNGTSVPLNQIEKYGTFGIIAVLASETKYPTHIYAKKSCSVCFLSKSDFMMLFMNYPDIALNTVEFLAGRISFLNNKINTFSGSCVEEKLAHYILSISEKLGKTEFEFNRKRSAEVINTGRASLYRALASLKQSGLIDYDSKKIYINDLIGLERKSK